MNKPNYIRLKMIGLPLMQGVGEFSRATHLSKNTIYQLSKNADKYYKVYYIPKKNGKKRKICQPSKKLKGLQSWILVNILNKLRVSNSCRGFEKGTSILDNAKAHKDANVVLTLDLQDFFPSIDRSRVYNIFKSVGYNSLISTVMTNICTFEGRLPQGSPCSPKLANLSTWQLDARIQGYAGKRGISYTRYADDLTFSGVNPSKVVNLLPMLKIIIEDEEFTINKSKTRIAGLSRTKIVTGLVVSDGVVGIGKRKYKEIRAKIHHLTMEKEQKNIGLLNTVRGWIAYINSVDQKRYRKAKKYIKELQNKYPKTLITKL